MLKNVFNLRCFTLLLLAGFIVSCTDDGNDVEADNFGAVEAYTIQKNLNAGKQGCLEIVYPISIVLPDSTVIDVESMEDAKAQLQAWRESNPDINEKPSVVYPIEVITQEGETVSIESRADIIALKRECRSNFGPRPNRLKACFELVYPLSVSFPDGSTVEVEDRQTLKSTVRQWKQDNPDAEEKPSLVYPLEIIYDDGTTATIESSDDLKAAKQACRE